MQPGPISNPNINKIIPMKKKKTNKYKKKKKNQGTKKSTRYLTTL
jgi:hypothetical protein